MGLLISYFPLPYNEYLHSTLLCLFEKTDLPSPFPPEMHLRSPDLFMIAHFTRLFRPILFYKGVKSYFPFPLATMLLCHGFSLPRLHTPSPFPSSLSSSLLERLPEMGMIHRVLYPLAKSRLDLKGMTDSLFSPELVTLSCKAVMSRFYSSPPCFSHNDPQKLI